MQPRQFKGITIGPNGRFTKYLLPVLLSVPAIGRAQESVVPQPIESDAGLVIRHYLGPRSGDIMPEITLPDETGRLWNSRDQVGRKALLVLICNMKVIAASPTSVPDDILDAARSSIVSRSSEFSKGDLLPVVIFSGKSQWAKLDPRFRVTQLLDSEGALMPWADYGAQFTILSIDRAGFLRRRETLQFPEWQEAGNRMALLGDTTPRLEVGKPAPEFSVLDSDGTLWSLADLRGHKNVLLTFLPERPMDRVGSQLPSLIAARNEFRKNATQVLSVSVEPGVRIENATALAQRPVDFPRIPDTGRNLSVLYDAIPDKETSPLNQVPLRQSILIDKKGIVRAIDREINIQSHGSDMVALIQKLE